MKRPRAGKKVRPMRAWAEVGSHGGISQQHLEALDSRFASELRDDERLKNLIGSIKYHNKWHYHEGCFNVCGHLTCIVAEEKFAPKDKKHYTEILYLINVHAGPAIMRGSRKLSARPAS